MDPKDVVTGGRVRPFGPRLTMAGVLLSAAALTARGSDILPLPAAAVTSSSIPTVPGPGVESPVGAEPVPTPESRLRADGGDDQLGFAGRRITLNGSQSNPREGISYRWFQMGGPKIERASQDRGFFSFSPPIPGVYRFGLIVAARGVGSAPEISGPDEVIVTVGESPAALGVDSVGIASGAVSSAALDQALRVSGPVGGRALLEQVAAILDSLSGRATLYTSFDYLTAEMMRRFDAVIPPDAATRQAWSQGVFGPMTQHLVGEMLSVGLDLRTPQAQQQELTATQKEKLRRLLSAYAQEFRSRTQPR